MTRPLHIGVFAQEASPTIREELARAAAARGHTYEILSLPSFDILHPDDVFEAAQLQNYDVLYYRTGLGQTGSQLLDAYLERAGRRAVNLIARKHPLVHRKTYQAVVAARCDARVPKILLDVDSAYAVLTKELGQPFIAKADVSSQGRDVFRIESEADLHAVRSRSDAHEFFYQEFVPHKHDCRIHIVGGKAVSGYTRTAAPGDFRTNLHQGGSMGELLPQHKAELFPLAEKIASHLELAICAVDFLPHTETGELYFAELNSNPGWQEWNARYTGVDVSECVLDYFESLARTPI